MLERYSSDIIEISRNGTPVLSPNAVFDFLYEKGYRKYYQGDLQESIFVRCDGHVASLVTIEQIIDCIIDELRRSGVTGIPQIMKSSSTTLSDYMMRANLRKIDISPIRDANDHGIFVFMNDIVIVSASGIHRLNKPPGEFFTSGQVVWDKDVINRDFDILPDSEVRKAHFNEFLKCAAGIRSQNQYGIDKTIMMYKRLVKSIGYLLHTYKKPSSAKAIVYMDYDSVMFEKSMGGTGKGIIVNSIDKLRPTHQIDGKRIDFRDRFVLSGVLPHHKVIALTDINKNFDFEMIFNWVTDMMPVENKFQSAYNIPFERSPKIVISTNYLIKGESDSIMRRKYDVLLFSFFNKSRTVEDYFGHLFFHDWDDDEWLRFYNFMMHCMVYYFRNRNMADDVAAEEYKEMKMLSEIGEDMYSYFLILKKGEWLKVKELYEEFSDVYSKTSSHVSQTLFSRRLSEFALAKGLKLTKKIIGGASHILLEDPNEDTKNLTMPDIDKGEMMGGLKKKQEMPKERPLVIKDGEVGVLRFDELNNIESPF